MENNEKPTRKAKRRLTDISFEHEGAHLALVHESQGHGANGHHYSLQLKATNFSEDFIKKASLVRVELDIPTFLERFFKLEEDDSKFLAGLMGYVEDVQEEAMESETDYQRWIADNVKSFSVIKAMKDSENYLEILSELDEEKYLELLQDQEKLEKGLKKVEEQKQQEARIQAELIKAENLRKKPKVKKLIESTEVEKSTEADVNTSITQREVEKEGKGNSPVVKTKSKETLMSKTQSVEVEVVTTQEMVEKSALEAIQKQFAETQEQLQKALATVAQFEQEKKELIAKQRLSSLEAVVAKDHADVIFKAVKDTADADFEAVVKALGAISAAVAQSDLFVEKGVVAEDKPVETESAVAKLLKAKLQAKQ